VHLCGETTRERPCKNYLKLIERTIPIFIQGPKQYLFSLARLENYMLEWQRIIYHRPSTGLFLPKISSDSKMPNCFQTTTSSSLMCQVKNFLLLLQIYILRELHAPLPTLFLPLDCELNEDSTHGILMGDNIPMYSTECTPIIKLQRVFVR
jgi:hypothetical protein